MCVHHDIARMAANSDRHANDVGDAGVLASDGTPGSFPMPVEDHLRASCGEQPGIMGLRIAVIMRAKQHDLGLVCGLGLRRVLHT